jgi:hypothetical protein
MVDFPESERFSVLQIRINVLEERLNRFDQAVNLALREQREETNKNLALLRQDIKEKFSQLENKIQHINNTVENLKNDFQQNVGRSSVLNSIGAAVVSIVSALLGAITTAILLNKK